MIRPTIRIALHSDQWQHIADPPIGEGGFQTYLRYLQARAQPDDNGGVTIRFDKRQLGDLVFHMLYNVASGGYQGKLRKAFGPALKELLRL